MEDRRGLKSKQRTRLDKAIKRAAFTASRNFTAQAVLNDLCEEIYGTTASDIDCDQVLDGVMGLAGDTEGGMTVDEFDTAMRESMAPESDRRNGSEETCQK